MGQDRAAGDVGLLYLACGLPLILVGLLGSYLPLVVFGAALALLGLFLLILGLLRPRPRPAVADEAKPDERPAPTSTDI